MNSKAVGEVAEGLILGKLLSLGYVVLIPFGNNQRYDLVVDKGFGFLKAQCKSATIRNGCVCFAACSTNGFTGKSQNYKGQIDMFLVYCKEINKYYEVPVDDIGVKTGYLRIEPLKRTEKGCSIKWAENYEI